MVAEPSAGDQPDLGVDLLDAGVRQPVSQRGLDPGALLGDRFCELDERLQAASSRPFQPTVEQLERLLDGDVVDLAQLLLEEVRAVDWCVQFLDERELRLLAAGQVLGVLPEREPGSLEVFGELLIAAFARLVPDCAADIVERVGRGFDDMERVQADEGVTLSV